MSTINYTYNVIVDRFRQFADGHFQLRRFTHGEISQADLEKEAEWPWMHVKPRAINYSPGTRAFSFEIFISDLPRDKEDKTGYQAESITDCSLIFQDLINEIHLGQMFGDDVLLTRPVNSEPFVEQYTHTLTGVTGVIELSMDYDWSACSIPASWNYNTPTDSPNDGFGALQFIESLHQDGVFVSLDNDLEAPGNSYYYGTDGSGVKGWYAIVDNIGLTCETLPDCAVIISIVDDIAALQTDVALKANTADLGATAFSNSYNDLDNLPTLATGTVTSIDLTAGTGISVSGGPITSSGSITVTNSAPDQVVAIAAGTGITTSGTYPNFTITNSAPSSGGTVTSVAALTLGTTGTDLSSTVATGTTTPVITLNVPTASAANRGALSSADWSTFNGKFTLPSLTSGSVLFSNGTTIAQDNANIFFDDTNNRLGIGTASPATTLQIAGTTTTQNILVQTGATYDIGVSATRFRDAWFSRNVQCGSVWTANIAIAATNLTIYNSSVAVLGTLFGTGNLLLSTGTQTDAGFKLDVNGTARISGLTRSTDVFVVGGTATTNTANARFWSTGGQAVTSGLYRGFYTDVAWIPSSGSAEWYGLDLRPTINQTGGANGVTRGLYIAATLTAAADFRAIETSVGKVCLNTTSGNTMIGTTTDIASSKLTIASTTQGFLPPRMTTTQKNAIATPATGLMVYDTTLNLMSVYNGTSWISL